LNEPASECRYGRKKTEEAANVYAENLLDLTEGIFFLVTLNYCPESIDFNNVQSVNNLTERKKMAGGKTKIYLHYKVKTITLLLLLTVGLYFGVIFFSVFRLKLLGTCRFFLFRCLQVFGSTTLVRFGWCFHKVKISFNYNAAKLEKRKSCFLL
jgi:hypothetical protein